MSHILLKFIYTNTVYTQAFQSLAFLRPKNFIHEIQWFWDEMVEIKVCNIYFKVKMNILQLCDICDVWFTGSFGWWTLLICGQWWSEWSNLFEKILGVIRHDHFPLSILICGNDAQQNGTSQCRTSFFVSRCRPSQDSVEFLL